MFLLVGGVLAADNQSGNGNAETLERMVRDAPMLMRTIGVAASVGVLATLLGFPAAWVMRRIGVAWSVVLIAPLLLPNYLVYASWNLLWAPGSALGNILANTGDSRLFATIDTIQAIAGLALWAWPIAAIALGIGARKISQSTLDALRLFGAPRRRMARCTLGMMRWPVVASVMIVTLLMLGSAVPLHVAQIETYAITIWRLLDETGGGLGAWMAATPLVVIACAAGWMIGAQVSRVNRSENQAVSTGCHEHSQRSTQSSAHAGWLVAALCVWVISVVIPLLLYATHLKEPSSLARFWSTGGPTLRVSVGVGVVTGTIGMAIALAASLTFAHGSKRRAGQRMALVSLRLFLMTTLVPGVLIGSGLATITAQPWMDGFASTRAPLIAVGVARYGALAALAGWWVAHSEPISLRDLRRLHAGPGFLAWWRTSGVLNIRVFAGVGLCLALLSLHEIEASIFASPPGAIGRHGTFAEYILRLLHFNRDEELTAAALHILAGGIIIGAIPVILLSARAIWRTRYHTHPKAIALSTCGALAMLLAGGGCDAQPPDGEAFVPIRVTGKPGRLPGQFVYPRCIDSDDQSVFIIDKSGRIQRLAPDGTPIFIWELDSIDNGFPAGITVGPNGRLYIADTHNHRVIVYDTNDMNNANAENSEHANHADVVHQFGEFGFDPGQFVYTTDIAIMPTPDGNHPQRIYVSEYGGNDRISVFDANGTCLFTFGREGSGERSDDICFRRPQSIAYDTSRNMVLVADAVNHRVGRFTPDGELVSWLGRAGAQPGDALGEFNYPYGLALTNSGDLLVAEFGNARVQKIDLDAWAGVRTFGRPGRAPGELARPWGITTIGRTVYVLDSGNHRLQSFTP